MNFRQTTWILQSFHLTSSSSLIVTQLSEWFIWLEKSITSSVGVSTPLLCIKICVLMLSLFFKCWPQLLCYVRNWKLIKFWHQSLAYLKVFSFHLGHTQNLSIFQQLIVCAFNFWCTVRCLFTIWQLNTLFWFDIIVTEIWYWKFLLHMNCFCFYSQLFSFEFKEWHASLWKLKLLLLSIETVSEGKYFFNYFLWRASRWQWQSIYFPNFCVIIIKVQSFLT